MERLAMRIGEWINETDGPKRAQMTFARTVGRRWVRACIHNLLHVDGLARLRAIRPERGVLLCTNHRSFFDQYIISCILVENHIPWVQRIYFPVRSNFFYESWGGILVNLLIGGGAMYPPIFRDASRSDLNKRSLADTIRYLQEPGSMVGVHPEGTRGKGPDPYELLPAQPGSGQIALLSRATIVPCWINGLSNDFFSQVAGNFRTGEKQGASIIVVFGDPVDLGELAEGRARPALYKRVADKILGDIRVLGDRERAMRASIGR